MHLDICISDDHTEVRISGDTYAVKDTIKSLGKARWDSVTKQWVVSGKKFSLARIKETFPHACILGNTTNEVVNDSSDRGVLTTAHAAPEAALGAASVTELVGLISAALLRVFPGEIKVFGSISSIKILPSGRVYFDLVDLEKNDVVIPCVIWESDAPAVLRALSQAGFKIENDLPVLLKGTIRLNSKRAQISLQVSGFVPEYTLGKLLAQREKTNTRLKHEKLFELNKKRHLPLLPVRLGILTSKGGTVINDFLASLQVCNFGFSVFWYPVRVQGDSAVRELCEGIRYFNKRDDIDVILVFRGGGSATELGVFNSYDIARTVCESVKPVLSAIGHEYDQTSVQDVSYLSCGVPKDLGRFLSDIVLERKRQFLDSSKNIQEKSEHIISDTQNTFFKTSEKIILYGEKLLDAGMSRVRVLRTTIVERIYPLITIAESHVHRFSNVSHLALQKIDAVFDKVSYHDSLLQAVSPETQLARGFALLRSGEESYISSMEHLREGDEVMIMMKDGDATTKILTVNKR